MRALICGSRSFNNKELLNETLAKRRIDCIIEGEARGADRLAREYAERHEIHVLAFPARWDLHKQAAGPIRNAQMLEEGRPDCVIAFWDGESKGTKNMIDQARKAGVPVEIIYDKV